MKNLLKDIESSQLKSNFPVFGVGDTVRVNVKIKEGDKERVQAFEGVVIAHRKGSVQANITVRKTSYGVGVERVFPLHTPAIDSIDVVTRGEVRRAKLYYLRELAGKAARIKSADTRNVTASGTSAA